MWNLENALQLISDFNKENFSFFHWCLGEKAKDYLKKEYDINER